MPNPHPTPIPMTAIKSNLNQVRGKFDERSNLVPSSNKCRVYHGYFTNCNDECCNICCIVTSKKAHRS